ncbi:MAG: LamG-like jellyroll fold domain-containing protein [Chthoniobacterales bacterium]
MRPSRLLLFLFAVVLSVQYARADINHVYCFDDNRDPAAPSNSSGEASLLRYSGESGQTTKECKFGTGSMMLKEAKGKRGGPVAPGLISNPGDFSGEIHKMSFTTWILPAVGNINISLIHRISKLPYTHTPPGSFQFGYSRAYHCLFFKSIGKDGQILNAKSSVLHSILGGLWVQVGFTFDEGNVTIYVNGVAVGNDKSPAITSIPALPQGFIVAFNNAAGSYVDDFALIFDRAFTESEMDQVYTEGLANFLKAKPSK